MKRAILFFSLLLAAGSAVFGRQQRSLSLETMNDPSLFKAFSVPRTWWLTDETAYIYDPRTPADQRTLERLDPQTGTRTPVLIQQRLRDEVSRLYPDATPTLPPIPPTITQSGSRGLYLINGDILVVDLPASTLRRITSTPAEESCARFSPDGNRIAYVREKNIYVHDLSTGKERQLTTDGGGSDPERNPVLGLLGGDLRATGYRLLVVSGFPLDRLSSD